uniref:Putative secreted protein n=1 Tax=Ixodes ricinus TaxID=34613 RepID=A0A090XD26_IXORI
MILLNILLVISALAYGTPLSLNTDVDETNNSESQIVARDSKGVRPGINSGFLNLYIFYSNQFKKHLQHERKTMQEYLTKFVDKIDEELGTGNHIDSVQFVFAGASMWNEASRALAPDKISLDKELLLAILRVYAKRLERTWHKLHHHSRLHAVLFLTPQKIKNGNPEGMKTDVVGQKGAICSKRPFVAAAQDKPGHFTGVKSAADQLSAIHRRPKCLELIPPSNVISNAIME